MAAANENSPPIGRATVLDGARRYGQTYSATYVGLIRDESGENRRAIIKDLPLGDLVRELIGTAIAIRSGMQVPLAFLAVVEDGALETAHGPALDDSWRLVFATEYVAGNQVAELMNGSVPERITSALLEWNGLPMLFAFDTWVANVDRHAGNLLVCSPAEFYAIDHGHCLAGPKANVQALDASIAYRNRLSEWLVPLMSPTAKINLLGALANLPKTLFELDIGKSLSESLAANADRSLNLEAVGRFLAARREHLVDLSHAAFGRA